jgi:hypothetical protein
VGSGTGGSHPRLQAPGGHQVAGTSRFHGGVARKPSGAPANQSEHWVMYFDGSPKLGGDGVGVLFISPREKQLKYVFQIPFEVYNNEAEYEALLHGLRLQSL